MKIVLVFYLLIFPLHATASDYMEMTHPNKLALIVTQSNYVNFTPLPSSQVDGERMKSSLEGLGFKVDIYSDSDFTNILDIEDLGISPFRSKIKEGDLVLLYFSGHGFSHSGYNFFVPADMNSPIPESRVPLDALLLESVALSISQRKPAAILMLVDACRSFPGIIQQDGRRNSTITQKGPYNSSNSVDLQINLIAGFASRPGQAALTRSLQDEPSFYTKHLAQHITHEDLRFEDVHKQTSAMVLLETEDKQQPTTFDWTLLTLYLNPTDKTRKLQREKWTGALHSNSVDAVRLFVKMNPLSPYLDAAKRWLKDAKSLRSPTSFSRLSPLEVDKAWVLNHDTSKNAYVKAVQSGSPIAFPRLLTARNDRSPITCHADRSGDNNELCEMASLIASVDKTVFTSEAYLRDKPSHKHSPSKLAKPNTTFAVDNLKPIIKKEQLWLMGSTHTDHHDLFGNRSSFIPFPDNNYVDKLSIGTPILELDILDNPDNFPGLINREKLENDVNKVKSDGYRITWVSISSGRALETSPDELAEKSIHARLVLSQLNIDSKRITSILESPTVEEDSMKARIFGYKLLN